MSSNGRTEQATGDARIPLDSSPQSYLYSMHTHRDDRQDHLDGNYVNSSQIEAVAIFGGAAQSVPDYSDGSLPYNEFILGEIQAVTR